MEARSAPNWALRNSAPREARSGRGRCSLTARYQQFLDNYAAESAIKRLNTLHEVAAMATLLASELGGGITGALINVDGGTAQW